MTYCHAMMLVMLSHLKRGEGHPDFAIVVTKKPINLFWASIHTVCRLYFETLEGRFMFSFTFRKLSLDFNLEYLSHFFINFNNQWQFWNPHDKQSSNLSLVFEFAEELTEIIDNENYEDEINFWKISTVFNLKYLNQNFIKLSL